MRLLLLVAEAVPPAVAPVESVLPPALERTIREACDPEARLLVIEHDLAAPEATLSDLQMLVVLGGRERSETQYRRLLLARGFALSRSIRTDGPLSLLEALPV